MNPTKNLKKNQLNNKFSNSAKAEHYTRLFISNTLRYGGGRGRERSYHGNNIEFDNN